jgi:hypothetical protein
MEGLAVLAPAVLIVTGSAAARETLLPTAAFR